MAKAARVTLNDVAREVGVSAKTVSRVLNEDAPVSAATRARVLAAVSALGFRPNLMARNMRVGARDPAVGLVVPDLGNPFFGTVAARVEDAVRARGLTLIVGSSGEEPERAESLISTFLARQVSALMVVPALGGDHRRLRAERSGGLPVVFLDRPPRGLAADCVLSANRDGARAGTAHLAAHGHRRIAFVGDLPAALHTRRERERGYREALAEAGLTQDRTLLAEAHDQPAAAEAARALLALPDPPTAVLAANNLVCMGVFAQLGRLGRKDVALVGFDDVPLAESLDPPLTVVAQDPAAVGRAAAEVALARLDGDRSRARTTVVPTRLLPRGSGELPPPAPA